MKKYFLPVLFLCLVLNGCAGMMKSGADDPAGEPPVTSTSAEFPDIMIPSEMTRDNETSYVVQTPGFTTGVLAYTGRVTRDSLVDFFKASMPNDNWNLITILMSPRSNTILLFNKASKWCIINIMEKSIYTYVEIAVVPGADGSQSMELK